jgi:hypothetical protein
MYQLQFTHAAPYAVVDHAVQATGRLRKTSAKGLVNAVLRNFLRRREEGERQSSSTALDSIRTGAADTINLFRRLLGQSAFFRLLVFFLLIGFLKAIFLQMDYVFPKFGDRELGLHAPVGKLAGINAIVIIFLAPVVGALTRSTGQLGVLGARLAYARGEPDRARQMAEAALRSARICHLLTVAAFVVLGVMTGLGWLYWAGVVAVSGLFVYEHSLVSPDDLSRLDIAFFNINGYIAVILFAAVLGGRML